MTNETRPLTCTKCGEVADGCAWSAVRVDLCSVCHPPLAEMECGGHKISFGLINDKAVLVSVLHRFNKKGILSYPDFDTIDNTIDNMNKDFASLLSNKSEMNKLVHSFKYKQNTAIENAILLGDEINHGILKYLIKEECASFVKISKNLLNLISRRALYSRLFFMEDAGILVSDMEKMDVDDERIRYYVKEYHISKKHIHWVRDVLNHFTERKIK